MRILILMPLQEQYSYMAMGIEQHLPSELKNITLSMPNYMEYLILTHKTGDWIEAAFGSIRSIESYCKTAKDYIIIGNVTHDIPFDAIFNFQDLEEALPYKDDLLDYIRPCAKKAAEEHADVVSIVNILDNLYTNEDSRLALKDCKATADFIANYFKSEVKHDSKEQ